MEHLVNDNVKNIEISGIRKFFNMVSDYKDVVSLSIGQPDFPTPEHVKQAGIHAISRNQTIYTPNAGIFELREAISNHVQRKYQLEYDPSAEVIVTVGASQAIDISLRTILSQGDEVILPGPVYPGYEPLIRLAGGKPVYVDTRPTGFKMTAEAITAAITPATKCIILPYPSNPTGVTLSRAELEEISAIIKERDLFVLCDEIYSELVYDQEHVSLASFPEIRDKVLVVNGVSKSHSMTGWRIGYLLGPAEITRHILKVHQYNVSCATSISQYAALEAIHNGGNDPEDMKKEYDKRRKYIMGRLDAMGLRYERPGGAFYILPEIRVEGLSSFELGVQLVKNAGLAIVPGDAFSQYGQGYMRISYAYDMKTLAQGLDRLENFLEIF
ncbi:aminotransferase A [Thalassobacillus pellis]|uniref:aminotransferase A n=1 Tax=Thalassobacillus pellis TaxID=748008 RepID=UPI001960F15A|nr:aminotransferase A [Thalassobacillus pellis]MBM7552968.1 aminotransferase [Thalassobacillus pellis]